MNVPNANMPRDLTRTVFAVLLIGALIAATFWILRPFLLSVVWAAMIVVATWPLMIRVQGWVRRRGSAVAVMTGAMLLLLVVPLVLAIRAIVENTGAIAGFVESLATREIPPPPEWVAKIPMVGATVAEHWTEVAAGGKEGLLMRAAPYAADTVKWLASHFGDLGVTLFQFLLTVAIAALMYAHGEVAGNGVIRFCRRLAGNRGEDVARLAGQAVRGVALGVVVTAVVQTLLAGLGLAVAGVPFAAVLTAVILFLCIAQVGPLPVLIPAVIWLFYTDATVTGVVLGVWSAVVAMLDNVLRPMLIRMGADLPILLIFSGVIGGLFAFGIIGLFVGPVVLAVAYTLVREWVNEQPG